MYCKKMLLVLMTVLIAGCGSKEKNITESGDAIVEEIEEVIEESKEIYKTEYITIEKIGEMADRNYRMEEPYGLFYYDENLERVICDVWGNPIDGTDFHMYCGNVVLRYNDSRQPGLYELDGTPIVETGTCSIKQVHCKRGTSKYFIIAKPDREVGEEENWLIEKKDHYYTGEIRIYDSIEKQFVENIVITDRNENVSAIGNSIVISNNKTGEFKLYDSHGKLLKEIVGEDVKNWDRETNFLFRGNVYYPGVEKNCTEIYDCNGDFLFAIQRGIEDFEVVTDGEFVLISGSDSLVGCVDKTGKIILPTEYERIDYIEDGGYYVATKVDEESKFYTIFTKDGILIENVPADIVKNFGKYGIEAQENTEEGLKYLVLDNGEYATVEKGVGTYLIMGLLCCYDENGQMCSTLMDRNSGKTLLPMEYDYICESRGKLYAFKNGIYSVFEVTEFNWPIMEGKEFANLESESIAIAVEPKIEEIQTEQAETNKNVIKFSERTSQYVEDFKVLEHINNGLILYVPNEDNTKLECVPWDRGELADWYIVEELVTRGILPSGSLVETSYTTTPKNIYIDKIIEEYLHTLTPEQEDMVMASLALSMGANNGHREVAVYSSETKEPLVTNNYEYDVPVSPEYYYELLQGAVNQNVQNVGGMDNVELGGGPEAEEQKIAMARISEVITDGSDPYAWESMSFSAAGVSGTVGVSTFMDMQWEPGGKWVNVNSTELSRSYQQYEDDTFSSIEFISAVNSEEFVVAAMTCGGDFGVVPFNLPGNVNQFTRAAEIRGVYGTPDCVSPDSYYYFSDDYTKALRVKFARGADDSKVTAFELVDMLNVFDYSGDAENKQSAIEAYIKETLGAVYGIDECKYIDEDIALSSLYTEVDDDYNLCRVKVR